MMINKKKVFYPFILLVTVVVFAFCGPTESFAYEGYDYEYYDSTYHITPSGEYEQHWWFDDNYDEELYDTVTKLATLESKGKCIENCGGCGASRTVTYGWTLDIPLSDYNKSYNVISHSAVYRNSKSITVHLDNAKKGSVVKVKIGKKTYSKKVGTKKKIKIKIKKSKYGSNVSINVYYKGKVIGNTYWWDDDDSEYIRETGEKVYYAKKIKKGLTKKQVKYLYDWGEPDDTASASGGWSYWYYDDGSYISFKKGKVKKWYDAAG